MLTFLGCPQKQVFHSFVYFLLILKFYTILSNAKVLVLIQNYFENLTLDLLSQAFMDRQIFNTNLSSIGLAGTWAKVFLDYYKVFNIKKIKLCIKDLCSKCGQILLFISLPLIFTQAYLTQFPPIGCDVLLMLTLNIFYTFL